MENKTSLDYFIFWPLKSFLIEIRLTAVGGEEMDFPESIKGLFNYVPTNRSQMAVIGCQCSAAELWLAAV